MRNIEKRLFNVEEYYRIAETGLLEEGGRVELIEGEILRMTPIGSRHAACVKRLNNLFGRSLGDTLIMSVQDPIQLSDLSEPEPDLALLKLREDFYAGRHPRPADVLLVVEVSDTSMEYDTAVKLPLYAAAGIPEAWIVDLDRQTVEVHSNPATGTYRQTLRAARGESFAARTVPGLELAVEDILG